MENNDSQAKLKILDLLEKSYCRIKSSPISGVGVFAIRDIPKHTEIFAGQPDSTWHNFQMSELKSLDKEVLTMIDDFFVIEKDQTVRIPEGALSGMDMSYYMNNSFTPNAEAIDGGFTFISSREIKKGEEITIAYSTFDEKYA